MVIVFLLIVLGQFVCVLNVIVEGVADLSGENAEFKVMSKEEYLREKTRLLVWRVYAMRVARARLFHNNQFNSHGHDKTENKPQKENENTMSKETNKKHWTEYIVSFAELQIGENILEITGEPYITSSEFGDRLYVPTTIGVWRMGVSSPVSRKLSKIEEEHSSLKGVVLTVVKTGEGKDTRYDIKKIMLPKQRMNESPPPNQKILNLEQLTPEQQKQIEEITKPKQ